MIPTAFIPENCWPIITTTAMTSGNRNIGFSKNSRKVTFGNIFIFSYSFFISSISSWTSEVALSHTSAEEIVSLLLKFNLMLRALPLLAALSSPCDTNRYLGDSGQNGSAASWNIPGTMVMVSRTGQPCSLPRICSVPRNWDSRMEIVMTSW